MKTFFWILLIAMVGGGVWLVFALWTGIYSVYSIPPGKEEPDGVTLLVSRDPGEPVFNSPDYKPPERKFEPRKGGMSFQNIPKGKKTLADRTILKVPYIEWAYKKSLEAPAAP